MMHDDDAERGTAPAAGRLPASDVSHPTVTVVMLTFNHARFVEQAVESVMAQEGPFAVNLEISDDASTDGTPEILERLRQRFPRNIALDLRTRNVGVIANFCGALGRANGTYIAICEGDDYWCDPQKLAKQVAVMDATPTAAICFTDVWIKYDDAARADTELKLDKYRGKRISGLPQLLVDNFIPTCTVMFRNFGPPAWPEWAGDVLHGDWVIHLMNAAHGEIVHLPEPTAVYRRHAGGVWSARTTAARVAALAGSMAMLDRFDRATEGRHARFVRYGKSKSYLRMARLYIREGDLRRARSAALRCLGAAPYNPAVRSAEVFDILLRSTAPTLRGGLLSLLRQVRSLWRKRP